MQHIFYRTNCVFQLFQSSKSYPVSREAKHQEQGHRNKWRIMLKLLSLAAKGLALGFLYTIDSRQISKGDNCSDIKWQL